MSWRSILIKDFDFDKRFSELKNSNNTLENIEKEIKLVSVFL